MLVELFLEFGRALNLTMVRALQAAGDVRYPMVMSIIFTWCFSVTIGYFLGVFLGIGLVGVWIAMAIDEIVRGSILVIRFYRGKWKALQLI